jgi:hypothetical protein
VSAAIAAAGAVQARKEQPAYPTSLVILLALPSIFLLPAAVDALGLPPAVAGARIGGNIDTTAAVSAAGAIVGEEALQTATIVKTTQNALLGIVAVALTAYSALRVERSTDSARPRARELWERFPKFVLGFLLASIVATVFTASVGSDTAQPLISTVDDLRTIFLMFASVSIGLEFRVAPARGGLAARRGVRERHGREPGRRPRARRAAVLRVLGGLRPGSPGGTTWTGRPTAHRSPSVLMPGGRRWTPSRTRRVSRPSRSRCGVGAGQELAVLEGGPPVLVRHLTLRAGGVGMADAASAARGSRRADGVRRPPPRARDGAATGMHRGPNSPCRIDEPG